jgi:hypothetical protein
MYPSIILFWIGNVWCPGFRHVFPGYISGVKHGSVLKHVLVDHDLGELAYTWHWRIIKRPLTPGSPDPDDTIFSSPLHNNWPVVTPVAQESGPSRLCYGGSMGPLLSRHFEDTRYCNSRITCPLRYVSVPVAVPCSSTQIQAWPECSFTWHACVTPRRFSLLLVKYLTCKWPIYIVLILLRTLQSTYWLIIWNPEGDFFIVSIKKCLIGIQQEFIWNYLNLRTH